MQRPHQGSISQDALPYPKSQLVQVRQLSTRCPSQAHTSYPHKTPTHIAFRGPARSRQRISMYSFGAPRAGNKVGVSAG